jgi:glycolate oxidase iron-sulfur subunit
MYDMKRLARLVRTLEDQLVVCMRCGMCQAICPLFAETGRESDVARGTLALLDGLLQEMFEDPTGVSERLSRCLLCGSCAANCPSGVKVLDIFLKARAILTGYMGLSPVKKALFRGMLAHPGFFDRLMEWGSRLQFLFAKPADDLLGTSCARFLSPLADRHFKSLAPAPFHRMVSSLDLLIERNCSLPPRFIWVESEKSTGQDLCIRSYYSCYDPTNQR